MSSFENKIIVVHDHNSVSVLDQSTGELLSAWKVGIVGALLPQNGNGSAAGSKKGGRRSSSVLPTKHSTPIGYTPFLEACSLRKASTWSQMASVSPTPLGMYGMLAERERTRVEIHHDPWLICQGFCSITVMAFGLLLEMETN